MELEDNSVSSNIECCVCFRNCDNDKKVLFLDKKLCDVSKSFIQALTVNGRYKWENCLLKSCCNTHYVCISCIRKIATNFDNHPIGLLHSLIPCPYPYEECISESGICNYFSHADIYKIIFNEEKYTQYLNHAERYEFPGHEVVKCPRPMIMQNHPSSICGALILVPIEKVRERSPGNLIIECDQNPQCGRKSCYHCLSLIRKYGDIDDIDMYCDYCITNSENTNPRAHNHYFYKMDKRKKDGQWLFYRNEELTLDIVIAQLLEIVNTDKGYIRCFECLTIIQKTEQCNTVTCCKIERCYACGRSGSIDRDLGDHWDSAGIKGCPRFDNASFWNDWANCDFQCIENVCYSQTIGDCQCTDHQLGIENTIIVRKKAMIYHAIKSLLIDFRGKVLSYCYKLPQLKPFLPKMMSSDTRTYIGDITYKKHLWATKSVEQTYNILDEFKRQLSSNKRVSTDDKSDPFGLSKSDSFGLSKSDSFVLIDNIEECMISESDSEDDDGFIIDMEDIEECERIIKKIGNIHFNKLSITRDL